MPGILQSGQTDPTVTISSGDDVGDEQLHRLLRAKTQFSLNPNTKLARDLVAHNAFDDQTPIDAFGDKASVSMHILVGIMWISISGLGIFYALAFGDKAEKYDRIAYGIILAFLSVGSICLNLRDDTLYGWKSFQLNFETVCGRSGLTVYGSIFFVISLFSYTVIVLEEEGLWENTTADFLIYVSFYIGLIFFMLTFLAGWEVVSYYCATVSWIHGFLYLTIIGGIALESARLLRPPPHGEEERNRLTWHKQHETTQLIEGILLVVNLFWWFFVVLGCVGLALFSEFAVWASGLGVGWAVLLFTIGAFAIMLNPIAPGSVIDACGGFLFVMVFVKGWEWGFYESWLVGLVVIIAYHYAGACIQWWIGTIPAIQIWLNTYMPVEMLSTTDAVLIEASWFEVGLIGYVFLDTLNGLNQGRINMAFWTQLWSEWACVPSAISLSALGASIATEGLQDELGTMNWISVAVPLLILVSGMVSMGGGMFGLKALGDSTDKEACWTAREKWSTMHYFNSHGYASSQKGWNNDVYQLASSGNTKDGRPDKCLFAKVYFEQLHYVAQREAAKTQKDKLTCLDTFSRHLLKIRVEHINTILHKLDKEIEAEKDEPLFIKTHNPEDETHDFWSDAEEKVWKRYLQIFIIFTLIIAFWGSIVGFYMEVDLQTAVAGGWSSVSAISTLYWFALGYFFVVYNVYNYQYWIDSVFGTVTGVIWMATGCATLEGLETEYGTPKWEVPVEVEREAISKLIAEFGADYYRADAITHKENENVSSSADPESKQTKFQQNVMGAVDDFDAHNFVPEPEIET